MNKRIRKKHRDKIHRALIKFCEGLAAVNSCPSYPWFDIRPKAAKGITREMMLEAREKLK